MIQPTRFDTEAMLWSPQRDKIALSTSGKGLQVFICGTDTQKERSLNLSHRSFGELSWSEEGQYLAARSTEGIWYIFRFGDGHAYLVYRTDATTLEWMSSHQVVFVPRVGGLTMIDLRDTLHKIYLAG